MNKGTFVQTMARRLAISTDAVATIGDMHNDVAMFEVSGLSFAMGNASDEVKKHAKRVTYSNEEDGFARAMQIILWENEGQRFRPPLARCLTLPLAGRVARVSEAHERRVG